MVSEEQIWNCDVINNNKQDRIITWIILNGVLVFVFTLIVTLFVVGFFMKWNFFEDPLSGKSFLCLGIAFFVLSIYALLVLIRISNCRKTHDNELYTREQTYKKY